MKTRTGRKTAVECLARIYPPHLVEEHGLGVVVFEGDRTQGGIDAHGAREPDNAPCWTLAENPLICREGPGAIAWYGVKIPVTLEQALKAPISPVFTRPS